MKEQRRIPEITSEQAAEWVADLADPKQEPVGRWKRLVDHFSAGCDAFKEWGIQWPRSVHIVAGHEIVLGNKEGEIPLNDTGKEKLEQIRAELEANYNQVFPSVDEVVAEIEGNSNSLPPATVKSPENGSLSALAAERARRKLAKKEEKARRVKSLKLDSKSERHLSNLRNFTGRFKGIFYENGKAQNGRDQKRR